MDVILDREQNWRKRKDKLLELQNNCQHLTETDWNKAKIYFFTCVDDHRHVRYQLAKLLKKHNKISDEDLRRDWLLSIQKLAKPKKNYYNYVKSSLETSNYSGATGGGMPPEIFQVILELRNIK